MSAELAPGFRNFLVLVAVIFVGAIVLGIVGSRAKPATAHTARIVNRYILLTTLAVIAVFPIYITVVNSFLEPDRIAQKPPALFAWPPTGSGYSLAWNELNVSEYLKNSVVVTTSQPRDSIAKSFRRTSHAVRTNIRRPRSVRDSGHAGRLPPVRPRAAARRG